MYTELKEDNLNCQTKINNMEKTIAKLERKLEEFPEQTYIEITADEDPLYDNVKEFAIEFGKISASLIQRKYRIGYNRAARLIDLLEERGVIGPQNGANPREILIQK